MCSFFFYTQAVLDVGGVYRQRGVETHNFKKAHLKCVYIVVTWLYKTVQMFKKEIKKRLHWFKKRGEKRVYSDMIKIQGHSDTLLIKYLFFI